MGPIDYSLNVPDPQAAFLTSLQQKAGIEQIQLQRQMLAQQMQAQQQMSADLGALASNPNAGASDYAAVMVKYPQLAENIKRGYDVLSQDQQRQQLQSATQVYSAIQAGRPDLASQLVRQRAAALRNSGKEQEARAGDAMAALIDANPGAARSTIAPWLAGVLGPDKFEQTFKTIGAEGRAEAAFPAEQTDRVAKADAAVSDAAIKRVQAANAPTATTLGNEKTAQEIRASQLTGDIARLDVQIRAADSETKRGELQLQRDKLNAELSKLGQAQTQTAQDSQNATTNALQTLQQIKEHPGMTGWNRPGEWSGAMVAKLPGTDRYALEGWVDSLKAQLGFQNLMGMKAASPNGASGLGALSEGELRMLSNLAGNLDLNSKDFPKQLTRVESYLQKAQATTVARGNLPQTGEAFVMKHPVYGNVTEGQINALMKQFPGSTRQQILSFLQSTGGK